MSIWPPLLATSQLSLTDRQTNSRLENTKLNWEQNNVSQELQIITFWPLHYKRGGLVSRRCCWGRLINSNHFPPKTISRRIFADLGIRPRLRATFQLQNMYQCFSTKITTTTIIKFVPTRDHINFKKNLCRSWNPLTTPIHYPTVKCVSKLLTNFK